MALMYCQFRRTWTFRNSTNLSGNANSNLLECWVHINALIELCVNIVHEGASFLVVSNGPRWLHWTELGIILLLPAHNLGELLVRCLWERTTILIAHWRGLCWAYIKWTWVQFPKRVLFEITLLTEVVCLFALACNLLGHHIDVDSLCNHVRILIVLSYQVVGYSVG